MKQQPTAFYKKAARKTGRRLILNHVVNNMFQSAQATPANKLSAKIIFFKWDPLDNKRNNSFVINMTNEITASIFRSDNEGYVAVFRPFPGLLGHGACPEAASSDLLQQFLWGLNDISPSPEDSLEWEGCQSYNLEITPYFGN
jgi:hypothetical protein